MQNFISDFRLWLWQRGTAMVGALTLSVLGLTWSCGSSSIISTIFNIFSEDWFRILLILYAASVIIFLMTSDLLEYFFWRKGWRKEFTPIRRGLWAWEIGRKPEKVSMEFYVSTIQSQCIIVIPICFVLVIIFFRYYTRSFCLTQP